MILNWLEVKVLTKFRQGEKMVDMAVRMASELPEIKIEELSPEGRDFLEKIFIKDPAKRWTARMLLDHPFVADQVCEETITPRDRSPRSGPLDWIKKGSHHKSIAEKFKRLPMCQRRDCDASNHGNNAYSLKRKGNRGTQISSKSQTAYQGRDIGDTL